MTLPKFKKIIWNYYRENRRNFPWRNTRNPYKILVSEIMLQQTQAPRVVSKYKEFLKAFPNWKALASAPLHEVLQIWQGLGYNRRGLALQKCAQIVVERYASKIPKDFKQLIELPSIGPATAGDILAFAFNIPSVIIETNIRSVFIHHFFADKTGIHDRDILPLIEKTLDQENPREWYFALMDYGAFLKKERVNPSRGSAHYIKQSAFKGSNRELRGAILKTIITNKNLSQKEIIEKLALDKEKIIKNLQTLEKEGLIKKKDGVFSIT